ncbi:MAG TPA: hypothetical protein VIF34_05130 [Methylocystis sp.]
MTDFFSQLEDPEFFLRFVGGHFESAPSAVLERFPCTNTVSEDRIRLAHDNYLQLIKTYKVLLQSENPDHYKRSGALLHSLYQNQIITALQFESNGVGEWEEIEAETPLGYSHADAQDMVGIVRFYNDYHNELLSFDLSYLCCAAYEDSPREYDFNFLENICHYLWKNRDLNVDSCSMIFRALMHGS